MKEICVLKCLVRAPVNTKDDVVCIIGDWNAKVGNQEIPGVTGKFGLRVQNEAGNANSFAKRMHWS